MIRFFNKFLPYSRQEVKEEDIKNVVKVLKSDYLTQGDSVPLLEKKISNKVKSKYCVGVNSATSALHLSCLALGLKEKDILWTSPNSFVASANCGQYCGAEVDFVDIDPASGLIDVELLRENLVTAKNQKKLPKILIPVHFAGVSCDMEAIHKLSKEYGFSVIEDASHALGGKYKNYFVGSCKYSSITVFSFHPVKIITTGEGGCATTNDKDLAEKLYTLRSHGIEKNKEKFLFTAKGDWSYEQQQLGFNYRMSDIHAALGVSQLKRLNKIIRIRNEKLNTYLNLLSQLPLTIYTPPKEIISTVHLAVIKLDNKDPFFHKYIFNQLRGKGIGVQVHYTPIHLNPYYRERGFKEGDFPNAEEHASNALSIPLYTTLSESDQIRVAKTLKKLL